MTSSKLADGEQLSRYLQRRCSWCGRVCFWRKRSTVISTRLYVAFPLLILWNNQPLLMKNHIKFGGQFSLIIVYMCWFALGTCLTGLSCCENIEFWVWQVKWLLASEPKVNSTGFTVRCRCVELLTSVADKYSVFISSTVWHEKCKVTGFGFFQCGICCDFSVVEGCVRDCETDKDPCVIPGMPPDFPTPPMLGYMQAPADMYSSPSTSTNACPPFTTPSQGLSATQTPGTSNLKHRMTHVAYSSDIGVVPQKRLFSCSQCGTTFTSASGLRNHEKRVHLQKWNFECHICEKKFMFKEHYEGHLNMHFNIKAFKCPHCPKRFAYKTGVSLHIRNGSCEGLQKSTEGWWLVKLSELSKVVGSLSGITEYFMLCVGCSPPFSMPVCSGGDCRHLSCLWGSVVFLIQCYFWTMPVSVMGTDGFLWLIDEMH